MLPLTGHRDEQLEGTGSNLSSLNLLYYRGSSPLTFVSQTPKLQNRKLNTALVKTVESVRTSEKSFYYTKAIGMHKKLLTIWQRRRGTTKNIPQNLIHILLGFKVQLCNKDITSDQIVYIMAMDKVNKGLRI